MDSISCQLPTGTYGSFLRSFFSRCCAICLNCSFISSICLPMFSSCLCTVFEPRILGAKIKKNIIATAPPTAIKLTPRKISSTSSYIPASNATSPTQNLFQRIAETAQFKTTNYINQNRNFRQSKKFVLSAVEGAAEQYTLLFLLLNNLSSNFPHKPINFLMIPRKDCSL